MARALVRIAEPLVDVCEQPMGDAKSRYAGNELFEQLLRAIEPSLLQRHARAPQRGIRGNRHGVAARRRGSSVAAQRVL